MVEAGQRLAHCTIVFAGCARNNTKREGREMKGEEEEGGRGEEVGGRRRRREGEKVVNSNKFLDYTEWLHFEWLWWHLNLGATLIGYRQTQGI